MPSGKPIFYAQSIDKNDAFLDREETQHAQKVLRLQPHDIIEVIDGSGHFYEGTIVNFTKKNTVVKIGEAQEDSLSLKGDLHLAVAPTKNNSRMEWLLEKMTEIGWRSITPIVCRHSIRRTINPDRWFKILLSATKQSQRALIPQLNPLISFDDFISQPFSGEKFIAHLDTEQPLQWTDFKLSNRKVCILIGPEGDFSEEELKKAQLAGYQLIALGSNRLRTETAGLYAGIVYQTKIQSW